MVSVAAYSAVRPDTTHRCQVVCDSRSPVSRVLPDPLCRERKHRQRRVVSGGTGFGIVPEIADQSYVVEHFVCLLLPRLLTGATISKRGCSQERSGELERFVGGDQADSGERGERTRRAESVWGNRQSRAETNAGRGQASRRQAQRCPSRSAAKGATMMMAMATVYLGFLGRPNPGTVIDDTAMNSAAQQWNWRRGLLR